MASDELTGATSDGLEDLRSDYEGTPNHEKGIAFKDAYCLSRIGKQPDDYDGPQRYCTNRAKALEGEGNYAPFCRFHGGRGHAEGTEEHLDPLANMTHGYYAMEESMLEDLTDEEEEAFEHIIEKGAEQGITREDDFFAYESLVSLSLNIVTDARIRQVLNEEGVTRVVNEFGPDGQLVDQQDEEHHLLGISQKQRRLIMKLKDELALTRKHKDEMEAMEGNGAVDALLEGMGNAVDSDEQDYNPDDWEDESEDDAG